MASSHAIYQFADLRIASSIAMPELTRVRRTPRSRPWQFVILSAPYPGPEASWFHEWLDPDGRRWLRIGRHGNSYLLRFERFAAFVIDLEQSTIACHREPGTPLATVRHLLLNQVLPLLPGGRNRLVLHAAAVRMAGGAIGLVGRGGAGKSTLCAALRTLGCGLVTDDALVVARRNGRFVVSPSYGAIRLWPDALHTLGESANGAMPVAHYTSKLRAVDVMFDRHATPLERLYILAAPDTDTVAVSVRRLGARDAAAALLPSTFFLDIESRFLLASAFETLASVAEQIPVFTLAYPWDLRRLRQSADQLLAAIRAA
ncbi:MAG TPA: hypothetical protein VNJ02_14255 [Vicinamibacterales bacterium]|nr:hypothetical protein [Vicinamibacterales bacterium]